MYGAHSTRGAAVSMYKSLGLHSEEVCQLGQWKDIKSFTSHYLRLNASEKASGVLSGLVHKISPPRSAEPEWSRTPGTDRKPGGSDQEGEAQEGGEPTPPSQFGKKNFLLQSIEFRSTSVGGGSATSGNKSQ